MSFGLLCRIECLLFVMVFHVRRLPPRNRVLAISCPRSTYVSIHAYLKFSRSVCNLVTYHWYLSARVRRKDVARISLLGSPWTAGDKLLDVESAVDWRLMEMI